MKGFGILRSVFSRKAKRSSQDDKAEYPLDIRPTGNPGEFMIHDRNGIPVTRILTSPKEFAYRGRLDAAGMQ